MSEDPLRARLRDADPAGALPPVDPDRVSRLLEDVMSQETPTESRRSGTRGRSRLTWLVAAAAVVLLAGATTYVLTGRGTDPTEPPPDTAPAADTLELALPTDAGAGRCMTPTPAALGRAEVAFEGEVASVADGRVVLRPSQFYAGGPADQVEVGQASPSREQLLLGVRFEEGERYLVAADGGTVMVCGFSGLAEPRLADLYAEAFAG